MQMKSSVEAGNRVSHELKGHRIEDPSGRIEVKVCIICSNYLGFESILNIK